MKNKTNITTTSKDLAGQLKKGNLWFTALYTFIICVVAGMLVFSYFSVFTSSFYLKSFSGNYLVGVSNAKAYNNTKSGQILQVQKYSSIKGVNIGDEIFYSGNFGEGSGVVEDLYVTEGYITIKVNGQQKNIATSTIIGKVAGKTNFGGHILWFFQNWAGVITLNCLLVAIVVTRLILGLTIERTAKGRELKEKLKKQNQSYKKIREMQRLYNNTGLDSESLECLADDYNQNKQKLISEAKDSNLADAYKYLLTKVHRVYVTKEKLNFIDKTKITNCLELMCLTNAFDMDSEYMLTDLILRTPVVGFDVKNFSKSLQEYLSGNHTNEDLLCLMQVLYVLVKSNNSLKNAEIGGVITEFLDRLPQKNADNSTQELTNLANFIKNLIKF